jgi:DNA-binding NarL/FixJ family response regulator
MLGQEGISEQIDIQIASSRGKVSKREMDVLLLVKDGLRNPEIADQLGLSTKTVENHVRSILQKLGAKNRTEAVVIALKNSIIEI